MQHRHPGSQASRLPTTEYEDMVPNLEELTAWLDRDKTRANETGEIMRCFVPIELPCGHYEFSCGSGECIPRGWRCDHEEDCKDGADELDCGQLCPPHHMPCTLSLHCIPYMQLCDGTAQCPDGSDESLDACGELSALLTPRHL